jgi:16S rRNA (guanine527-N7)-methyltransferase
VLREALEPQLRDQGPELDEQAWQRLQTLLDLWQRYGRAMNLTGSTQEQALVEHIADGLAVVRAAQRAQGQTELRGAWVDIGSGGGFPGLIVAATTEVPLVLIEPRERRAAFLDLASRAIARPALWTLRARIDGSTWSQKWCNEVKSRVKDKIMIASARAVMAPAQWLELGFDVVDAGGHVVVHLPTEGTADLGAAAVCEVEGAKGRIGVYRRPG